MAQAQERMPWPGGPEAYAEKPPLPSSGGEPHPPLRGSLRLAPPPHLSTRPSPPGQVQQQQIKSSNLLSFFVFKDVTGLWLPWRHPPASPKSALSSLQRPWQPPRPCPALALPISAPHPCLPSWAQRGPASRSSCPSRWGGSVENHFRAPRHRRVSDRNELPCGTGLPGAPRQG